MKRNSAINIAMGLFLLLSISGRAHAVRVGNLIANPASVIDFSGAEFYIPAGPSASMPAAPSAGATWVLTDGTQQNCSGGGGTDVLLCYYDGTSWINSIGIYWDKDYNDLINKPVSPVGATIFTSIDCSTVTGMSVGDICFENP